ncbi:MAG: hypothetical protein MP439_09695 [Ferrimicrobium sp.]|jgi:hypothetical protein|nr:hypothetical protein [Ferrimicrobium sp.]
MQGLSPDFPMDEIIERYRDPKGVRELHAKAKAVGYCAHPIFLRASGTIDRRSTRISAEDYADRIARPCGSRLKEYCEACSYVYFGDSLAIVRTGLIGGKGVPEAVATHPKAFLTLTAPSYGPVHTANTRCHPGEEGTCIHGVSLRCGIEHGWDDPIIGAPLCYECFDSVGLILFNAHISKLWDYTLIELRRELSRIVGQAVRIGQSTVRLEYLRVFELQRRGALHAHVILRLDDASSLSADPSLGIEELVRSVAGAIPRVKVMASVGDHALAITWGPQRDLQVIGHDELDKVALYVAKYLSKEIGLSLGTSGAYVGPSHLVELSHVTGEMIAQRRYQGLIGRRSARSLGFSGHLLASSRRFSVSRTTLAKIRREFAIAKRVAAGEELDKHYASDRGFTYDGRHWASAGDAWLVAQERRSREEARAAGKEVSREETG